MSNSSDAWLDSQLRDVPLPSGMVARLRAAVNEDQEIDRLLSDVAAPAGLESRIKAAVEEARLDEALQDVPMPERLAVRLRRIPKAPRRPAAWVQWTAAAALWLVVCGLYGAWMSTLMMWARPHLDPPLVLHPAPNFELPAGETLPVHLEALPPPPAGVAQDDAPRFAWLPLETFAQAERAGPFEEALAAGAGGSRLMDDTVLLRWQIVGAALRPAQDVAPLETAWPLSPRGASWPRVPGYDRIFTWRFGAHPLIWPAQRPELATSVAPLTADTASFDLVERLLQRRRMPDPDQVRVEDFLAAVAERSASPNPGRLDLRVTTGPAPFGKTLGAEMEWLKNRGAALRPPSLPVAALQSPASLLYAEVQAGSPRRRAQPATHLTIALDASAGMEQIGGLTRARLAISQLFSQLQPNDRISLVVFNDRLATVVENVGRDSPEAALEALAALQAEGGADLGLGLSQALSLALGMPLEGKTVRRVALITDGQAALSPATAANATDLLRQMDKMGASLSVVSAGSPATVDPFWAELAEAGGGELLDGRSVEQMRLALTQALTGNSTLAASETNLRITFNPRNVAAYRLVGYEPTALGTAAAASPTVEIDLRAGQVAPALWEVWLLPETPPPADDSSAKRPPDFRVATVELEWRDPDSGRKQRLRKVIQRSDIGASWADAPRSFQAAALAAATAEGLRDGVYWHARGRNLDKVLALAGEVNAQSLSHHEAQRLLALIRRAEDVRRGRRDAP